MAKQDAFRVEFDLAGIEAKLDKMTQKAGEFVRPAAQAGADVLYKEARYRAPVIDDAYLTNGVHYFYGKAAKAAPKGSKRQYAYPFPKGTLRDSIYQAFSKDNSIDGKRATYHVAWNHQKAPYGFMVEFGTSRAAAHPFLNPAYDAAKNLALTVARDKFAELMESAMQGANS